MRLAPLILLLLLAGSRAARPDVVHDGSVGQEGPAPRTGTRVDVLAERGLRRGSNLFHSFSQFDLVSGELALFQFEPDVQRVIARVTGGASRIDGEIATLRAADVFLLNPEGLWFGPNARVDRINGGVFASSAHALRFGDVSLPTGGGPVPELAVGAPTAFGFAGSAAPLRVEGAQLRQLSGGRLALLGGDLEIAGRGRGFLSARAGEILLGSLRSGELLLDPQPEMPLALSAGAVGGAIRIADDAVITASVLDPLSSTPDNDPGRIFARAADLSLIDSDLRVLHAGELDGGNIDLELSGTLWIEQQRSAADVGIFGRKLERAFGVSGDGAAGEIRIRARDLVLRGGARISTTTEDAGAGGAIDIELGGLAWISGTNPQLALAQSGGIYSNTQGAGDAGRIELRAAELRMDDAGVIVAQTGVLPGNPLARSGRAGTIRVEIERGELSGFARIDSSSARLGSGGGDIRLIARESLSLSGGIDGAVFSGISALSKPGSLGPPGRIQIDAPVIQLLDGARISAALLGTDPGEIAAGAREGSDVELGLAEGLLSTLLLEGGSQISARSEGAADAGRIAVRAQQAIELHGGSGVDASAQAGASGGEIRLEARELVRLEDSSLSASVVDGDGGNVSIDPDAVVIRNSRILASAVGGAGGNIDISADLFFASESVISASSRFGVDGTVVIRSPDVDLAGELAALSSEFAESSALLRDACAARAAGRHSSLVLLGPEAAPATPELPLEPAAAGAAPAQRALRALEAGDAAAARQALDAAGRELNAAAAGPGTLRARLHVGTLRARLSRAPGGTAQDRIRAGETLARAASEAGGDDAASSWAWGLLAELYLDEQRSDEAAVLLRRALLAAQRAPEPAALFRWHARLGRLLRARGDLDAAIAQFRAGLAALAGLRLDASVGRARPELRRDPPLAELVEALLARAAQTEDPAARAAFVRAARDAAEDQGAAEMQDFFADACATARRVAAPDAAPGAVVVHPVLLPDRTELIVSRAAGIESVLVPVPGARVGEEARALRRLLQEPGTRQYLRPAQQLYDWLIRPLQAHLGSAIDTLVLVPLGPLRSLPLAALHDRERGRFLVESYPLAVAPGLGLTEPRAIDPARVRTLKGGLTRAIQGFRPLPHVAEELGAVGERFTGPTLLDTDFRESDLRDALAHQAFGIVHIASHARFGRDASETFLLTWDGRLGAAQLADLVSATDARPEPLELLALSACETALGDERSGLGLAGVAVKAGARSTLATLWSIDDLASSKLVAAFYRELARPGTSRGRALRAAQLELLADPRFAHPAYWAPFLLIGSWL